MKRGKKLELWRGGGTELQTGGRNNNRERYGTIMKRGKKLELLRGGEGRNYRGEGEITIKREIWNYKEKRDEILTMKGGGRDGTTEGRGLEKNK